MKLKYDSKEHMYHVGNRKILSVTGVIREEGLSRDWRGCEQAALRGKQVHEATALFDLGRLDEERLARELPHIVGYVEGWKLFLHDMPIIMQDIEQPKYCEIYDFAGIPDRLGWYQGVPVLISIKSGVFERAHIIQEAAYSYFYPEHYKNLKVWGVYLSQNGRYKKRDLRNPPGEFVKARSVFLAALQIVSWKGSK